MKSHGATYLLLAAVALIWGIIAWKILVPANDKAPAALPEPALPATDTRAADTLLADYPDPFLKGTKATSPTPSPVRTLPPARAARPEREPVKIVHLGTISAGARSLYILRIGDDQYELTMGGAAGGFVLAGSDEDSLYLRKGKIAYGVKICE